MFVCVQIILTTYRRVLCLCWCNCFWLARQRCQTSLDRRFSAIKLQCIRWPLPKRRLFFVVPTVPYHFGCCYCMGNTVTAMLAVANYFWLPFCVCRCWSRFCFVLFCTYLNLSSFVHPRTRTHAPPFSRKPTDALLCVNLVCLIYSNKITSIVYWFICILTNSLFNCKQCTISRWWHPSERICYSEFFVLNNVQRKEGNKYA